MAGCHDMKEGEIYVCENCGLELKLVKECKNSHVSKEECVCHSEKGNYKMMSCGKCLKK